MQRVYNLGYFEDVNIKLNPGREPNGVEVEISVVEMNTGTFGIGAGYSNADGFVGMVSIGDKNFRGIGDKINLRWEFGGEDNKNYDFSYTRPWLDDKETSATINLYDITNEYADYNIDGDEIARYDKKRRGQEITFSRRTHNEFVSNYITIKNRDDIYKGPADGYEGDVNQYYERSLKKVLILRKNGCLKLLKSAVRKTLVLPAALPSAAYMIPATISMIRMKASVSATA